MVGTAFFNVAIGSLDLFLIIDDAVVVVEMDIVFASVASIWVETDATDLRDGNSIVSRRTLNLRVIKP